MTAMSRVPRASTRRPRELYYPESDGQPMAETQLVAIETIRLYETLVERYKEQPNVYVGINMLLYFQEGNNKGSARVAPDIFVVLGRPKLPMRRTWKLWEEGTPPTMVIEITSRKTRTKDVRDKPAIYARIGVAEYVLYDPSGDYLRPPLRLLRLMSGAYVEAEPEGDGAFLSESLDLRLRLVDGALRLEERDTGAPLLSSAEQRDAALAALQRQQERITQLEAMVRGQNRGVNGST